jgi:hypothetical protein
VSEETDKNARTRYCSRAVERPPLSLGLMLSLNTPLRILFVGVVATPVERGFAGASNLLCRFLIAFYFETMVLSVIEATR